MSDEDAKLLPLSRAWERHLSRGMRALREGEFARASEAFERAHAAAPREPPVLLSLGRERLRQGRYDEAETLLRDAAAGDPGSAAAAATLARVLGLHQGRLEEAFVVVHRALAAGGDPAPLHVVRGELLLEEGSILDARAAFGQALDDALASDAARVGLARTFNAEGIALSEQGQCERAVFCFKRAADLDPAWSGPHVNLGVAFRRLGKVAKAAEAYAAALLRDPDNPIAYFNLGTAQHELGRHTEAVHALEELLLIAPDYPHARAALATVLGDRRDFDRAIALLLEELEADEECASCWSSLGLAYICSGNADRGEQCLLRALTIDGGYFNAIHNLATLYVTQRRLAEAEQLLERAFQLDPRRTAELIAADRSFEGLPDAGRFTRLPDARS